jgi:ectoine hydroxylase-related dioxygenase (phytanoyl-CoA dioxygenase family)
MTAELAATSSSVALDVVHSYRENGYVHVPQVLSPDEVTVYREAAREAYKTRTAYNGEDDKTFKQILQLWKTDETLHRLTFHAGLATIATQLAGVPLRLWHDQLLIKAPYNGAATEYHQDGTYWPHAGARHQLSAWIALVDVPVERGCMSFHSGHPPKNGYPRRGPTRSHRLLRSRTRGDVPPSGHRAVAGRRLHVPPRIPCSFGQSE